MMTNKIYFPGLNGLRAIAAFAVIISHINLGLDKFGLEKKAGLSLAGFGVTVFFALSGFLITYLLLAEKQKTGKIDTPKFYVRRILRIWPLYFLYLIVSVLIAGCGTNQDSIWYYIFILANVPFSFHAAGGALATIPLLAHYWSLAVEEQFYAFWPWIVKKISRLKLFLILFIVAFTLLKFGLKFLHVSKEIQTLLHYTRFGCLAIGGLGAYYFYYDKDGIKLLFSKYVEYVAWGIFFIVAIGKFHIASIIDHEIIAVTTLIIIINQISGSSAFSLENRVFDYLGKISFGLYVYNPLMIYLMSLLFAGFSIGNPFFKMVLVYATVVLAIVLVSHLSFRYFEKPFLRFKYKYTTIPSAASRVEAEGK